jgi:murein L,D-transpeptidase YcbB/YkuD
MFACNDASKKTTLPLDREAIIRDSLQKIRIAKFEYGRVVSAGVIREVFETRETGRNFQIQGIELYSSELLPKVYTESEFKPLWFINCDSLGKIGQMIDVVAESEFHGLQPEDYHYKELILNWDELVADGALIFNANFIAGFDLLLTDAFFGLSKNLYYGKLESEALDTIWGIPRNKSIIPFDVHLKAILNKGSVQETFSQFYPPYPGYEAMVAEAKRLRAIESSDFQVKLDLKQSIKPGDSLKSVALIKDKLAFLGFYQPDTINPPNLYDEMAVEAIRELQEQFGYNMDGAIGKNTLKALNMPVEQKINQLYVNMERLRWMPDSLEKVYLMVNIADFTLNVFSGNDTLLSMRTIVGKDARETPVFNSRITYMVMSPSWHVPPTIKKQDVIPSVIKDISYLEKKQMKVIDAKGNVVDPSTVNWKRDGMKYSIKQQPGAQNSLGKVKFMFPNKHNIYLHDTPSRSLFARDERTFSSGCIRVEKPFELASLLLSDKPEWTPERIKQAMDSGVEKTIVLKDKVGVYIYYLTAWGSASGKINYRADVYNRDKVIEEALSEKSLNKVL